MTAEVKWIKLTTDMFEDEKIRLIEAMPEADTILIIWVKLLSQAGKTNASGWIFLNQNFPYTDEMLSTIFRRPLATVRMALQVLKNFGMIEVDDNDFIGITNWDKHQNIDGLEKIREQDRIRKQRQREKKKLEKQEQLGLTNQSRDVTGQVTQSHATEVEEELELDFKYSTTATAIKKNKETLFTFYESNVVHTIGSLQSQKLLAWLDDFKGNEDVLKYAMAIAGDRNRKSFGMVEKVLKEWFDNGVDSLKAADLYEQNKYNNNKPAGTGGRKKVDLDSLRD